MEASVEIIDRLEVGIYEEGVTRLVIDTLVSYKNVKKVRTQKECLYPLLRYLSFLLVETKSDEF